jgi:hypothetical protein
MIAYKFLRAGGVGPFSGHAWPPPARGEPGPWVIAAAGAAVVCRRGVHACRPRDLPWWLQDELWEIELDGAVTPGRHKVMASRGRLLRRVDAWDAECAQRFADACARRALDHATAALDRAGASALAGELRAAATPAAVRDVVRAADPPEVARIAVMMAGDAARRARTGAAVVSAYIAAHVAAHVHGADANAAERTWQSEWLRVELGLEGVEGGRR